MSDKNPVIVWFRQDLRLRDNPALIAAGETKAPVLPVYILDDDNSGEWKMGAASRWWLDRSLRSLDQSLHNSLHVFSGDAAEILTALVEKTGAGHVFWNRCYEPWRIKRDKKIKEVLKERDIRVKSFNGSLLYEPHETLKDGGKPYKVFTPFYKKGCLAKNGEPRAPQNTPESPSLFEMDKEHSIDDLGLMPSIKWYEEFETHWQPGEDGAHKKLKSFLEGGLNGYKEGRNRPDQEHVSRLSPHLHFGEISPHTVWHEAQAATAAHNCEKDGTHFLSELGWREFSYNLLYHFPELTWENLQPKFNDFPWRAQHSQDLEAWQKGQTGVPMVDAGMRELWRTGYMHNRVRMIVGSFLVKNLLIHWHRGEEWFWDCLLDADLANNSASWQWIAGCGADAAPYFRIFNPVTQGQKFDPEGAYIRAYVPELKDCPVKYIHAPWEAPQGELEMAGITLGKTYPEPIVDLKASRERALEAFETIKKAG